MLEIKEIDNSNAALVNSLAKEVWEPTYGKILSKEQLVYMFDKMYSIESIKNQIENEGHKYYVAYTEGTAVGYFSLEKISDELFKLHKIYVIPKMQANGVGYFLLQRAILCARNLTKADEFIIQLNVNRHNTQAINFYKRLEFVKVKEVDVNIGNGFYMNDYILELSCYK